MFTFVFEPADVFCKETKNRVVEALWSYCTRPEKRDRFLQPISEAISLKITATEQHYYQTKHFELSGWLSYMTFPVLP